ncbi:MAG: hypothetical protein DRI32_05165 [Chloroflexi bacterium]|nr:MAG: hypothetical protein DRI32_05165 [Chloroflexota bacterium]
MTNVDKTYTDLLHALDDVAKEGPRLFSFVPVDRANFNPRRWVCSTFRLTLWCEHSKLPLNSPGLDGVNSKKGVYELEFQNNNYYDWFPKAAPYLSVIVGTLRLILPVSSSARNLAMDEKTYKTIEGELDFGVDVIDFTIWEWEKISQAYGTPPTPDIEQSPHSSMIRTQGNVLLRQLHTRLKEKDPGFGGLVRAMNKQDEFLWVHEMFGDEY